MSQRHGVFGDREAGAGCKEGGRAGHVTETGGAKAFVNPTDLIKMAKCLFEHMSNVFKRTIIHSLS